MYLNNSKKGKEQLTNERYRSKLFENAYIQKGKKYIYILYQQEAEKQNEIFNQDEHVVLVL